IIWQKLAVQEHAMCLARYRWPGNMRELSTFIKRFVLLGDDIFKELQEARLPAGYNELVSTNEWQRFLLPVSSLEDLKSHQIRLKELQPAFVRHIVESLGGSENIQPTKLAEALGCTYNTLKSCLN
ncbi:MAG: hypothetical protein WA003_07195, partial [Desulfuromonadaceae bacterium]